jgi:hypothetical protein
MLGQSKFEAYRANSFSRGVGKRSKYHSAQHWYPWFIDSIRNAQPLVWQPFQRNFQVVGDKQKSGQLRKLNCDGVLLGFGTNTKKMS